MWICYNWYISKNTSRYTDISIYQTQYIDIISLLSLWNWEKCCECVAEVQQTAFICVANVRWTAECYQFGVGTSKINTFTMLGVHLTRRMPNKQLFGICLGSPQSRMPRSHPCTNVDIHVSWLQTIPNSDGKYQYNKVSISIDTVGPVIDKYQ